MPLICYKETKFQSESKYLIDLVNDVIKTYKEQGYDLTLRQIYYQMVSRDYIPNNDKAYKRLGEILNNARLAGLVDWNSIEDRTRNLKGNSHWNSPGEIISACAYQYEIDKWADQEYHIEVFVEKDALIGVVGTACTPLDVSYFSCRGYVSQSEMWKTARRLMSYSQKGKKCLIIHLGDHDPSGIDMSRDIEERIRMFWEYHYFNETGMPDPQRNFFLNRIALNWDQIEQYGPPPNPAKMTDVRYASYMERFGRQSWELDALEPTVIGQLITDEVERYRDDDLWDDSVKHEQEARDFLKKASTNWNQVTAFLDGKETESFVADDALEIDFTVDFNVEFYLHMPLYDDTHRELFSHKTHKALEAALGLAGLYHFEDGAATDTTKYVVEEGDLGVFYVTIYKKVPDLEAKLVDEIYNIDETFNVTITGIPEDW